MISIIQKIKSNTNIRNGILFTFFSFLNSGINFLLLLILAGYLLPSGYGSLNLFNISIMVLTVLIPLGSTGYIANRYFRAGESVYKQVISIIVYISLTVLFLFSILFYCFRGQIEDILGLPILFQYYALLFSFFQLFTVINLEVWRIEEKPTNYGLYSLSVVLLNFVVSIFFVVQLNLDWQGRVYAQFIIGGFFFLVSFLFLLKRKLILFIIPSKILLIETLAFGLPLIPHLLGGWFRQGLDRYIINVMWGDSFVGLFSMAMNIGNIISMVGAAFNSSNAVFISKSISNSKGEASAILAKQTKRMILFFVCLSILIWAFSYMLIPYVFPKYIEALPLLLPLCLTGMFQSIYFLFVNYLFYFKKTKRIMFITLICSLLHLSLSLLLTKCGVTYTAYVSALSSFLICLFIFMYSQKIYPLFFKRKR